MRIAAGPISWGVCEVPGWGLQLDPDRVLGEMRSLGLRATETGPDGYLGADAASIRDLLDRHGLELVGGFLPIVLHDPAQLEAALAKVERTVALFAELGASVLCSALVLDEGWAPPRPLADSEWRHLLAALPRVDEVAAARGVAHVLHPHWGTLIERDAEVRRIVAESDVALCLDTGHLALGGTDTVALAAQAAERIAHVHLKDVDEAVAQRLRTGELSLVQAVQAGLFRPLGAGDAPIADTVLGLERAGYGGWYVLEQDVALAAAPEPGRGPLDHVRRSLGFLQGLARDAEPAAAREGG